MGLSRDPPQAVTPEDGPSGRHPGAAASAPPAPPARRPDDFLSAEFNGCCGGGQKGEATRWLVLELLGVLLLSAFTVALLQGHLLDAKTMGRGACPAPEPGKGRKYDSLGKWHDAPRHTPMNWFVCERPAAPRCDRGWLDRGDSCYLARCAPGTNWTGAVANCAGMNASLASIHSAEENRLVQELCGWEACWIGLGEPPDSEEWIWQDGVSIGRSPVFAPGQYVNWQPGEPNNWRGVDEDAAFMNFWPMLDMPAPTECTERPRQRPQGDGAWYNLPQAWDVPAFVCEQSNMKHCQDGWSGYEGSCYLMRCSMGNAAVAAQACSSLGAALVSIGSAGENLFVAELCGLRTCLIGLANQGGLREEWTWPDGTSVGHKFEWHGYTNWDEGQPKGLETNDDDSASEESAVVLNSIDIRKLMLRNLWYDGVMPLVNVWSFSQLAFPVVIIALVAVANKCNSSCFAQAAAIGLGVGFFCLVLETVLFSKFLSSNARVRPDALLPASPLTGLVLGFLLALTAAQGGLVKLAHGRAKELQWATLAGRGAAFAREVGGDIVMRDLSAEFAQAA
mmetsp:Transcript_16278/g.35796  ORF Transcript_16278/g.35796 Transcript_16278/m.35796 type:complete len:564 (-) Transcript_16278:98-1789(-)